jgi:hypothetical protein
MTLLHRLSEKREHGHSAAAVYEYCGIKGGLSRADDVRETTLPERLKLSASILERAAGGHRHSIELMPSSGIEPETSKLRISRSTN